jgi:ABC-2 type transport system permease protein
MTLYKRATLNLRLFFQGALLSYMALFRWLRPAQYLATKVISPLFQILFFTLLGTFASGRQNADFFIIGNAIQVAALSGIFGVTMSITGDRWEGTLLYLFGTPASRLSMFIGRALMHIVDGMFGVFIGFVWGTVLLGLDLSQTHLGALVVVIFITTFSTSGLGLLLGCLSLITRNVMFVNNTMYFLLLVFAGVNIPISNFPDWMQAISWSLPLTRGISAARQIIAGARLDDVTSLIYGEIALGLIYIVVGYLLFRGFEIQAKRRGTLEAF